MVDWGSFYWAFLAALMPFVLVGTLIGASLLLLRLTLERWAGSLAAERRRQRSLQHAEDQMALPPGPWGADAPTCVLCGKPVSSAVADYCRQRPQRFGGRIYCYQHQRANHTPRA